ncbi:MAG: hypothetical protein NPIRA02_29400 [Nitrospirales bacterium]|nr:MAG: hypothetical protein NPIRA02_29400 [Nitrospirales bacterium]
MKTYMNIGEHGLNGDFYGDDQEIFRADNLEIATKISINRRIREFDALYKSCQVSHWEPGQYTLSISHHQSGSGRVMRTVDETVTVRYAGPSDMYTIEYQYAHCEDDEIRELIDRMERMCVDGHPSVRRSKKTDLVMFAESVRFPRWHADGEWWESENNYLDLSNIHYAREQMAYALASDDERQTICKRNWEAMKKLTEVTA